MRAVSYLGWYCLAGVMCCYGGLCSLVATSIDCSLVCIVNVTWYNGRWLAQSDMIVVHQTVFCSKESWIASHWHMS